MRRQRTCSRPGLPEVYVLGEERDRHFSQFVDVKDPSRFQAAARWIAPTAAATAVLLARWKTSARADTRHQRTAGFNCQPCTIAVS
jgi:hypothetical protein